MNNQDLKNVQKVQLEIACEVKRICEANNIKYFINAGTLLGAVRHGGFIPWDDDLDIGMLREEYEKFIRACKLELDDKYFLQTWDTDKKFGLPIAKIRKNGTEFVEKLSQNAMFHNGIFIDVFPYDNVPDVKYKQYIQSIGAYILKRLIITKLGYEPWASGCLGKKLVYYLLIMITKSTNLNSYKINLDKLMKKYNDLTTVEVVAFGGANGYKKESIKRLWIEELVEISFNDEKLLSPRMYEEYLTYFYGDYMTPPPENQRYNRHKIIQLDLGVDDD